MLPPIWILVTRKCKLIVYKGAEVELMLPSTYYMIRLQLGASQRGCADADVSNIIETKATRRNRRKCENAGCLVAVSVFSMTFSSAQWIGE